MITVMRRYFKVLHVFLWLVIAAFIGSLFYLGTTGVGGGAPEGVATVNGETIPIERYQRRYQIYVDAYRQAYREQFTPELAERMGLGDRVIDDLVQEALVVQRAAREGLAVDDEELNAQVHAMRVFQENGRFSMERFKQVLRRSNLTETAFIADARRQLTRFKMEALVKNGAKVTEPEVEQAFATRRERVRAAWVLVDTSAIAARTTADDTELEAYLKDHQAEFRLPERRRIQYVLLEARKFGGPVSEADVERYYTEHAAEFETPRQLRVAHILTRVPETGGSEAENKAREKAQKAIDRVRGGEEFAKVAKEMSEDPGSAANGGEVGWISKGDTVPQFEAAAEALSKGSLSQEPVRTPFGFHAIKVVDIRDRARRSLKEVAPQLRERLAGERTTAAAMAKAEEVKPPLQSAKDFAAEARGLGLEPRDATVTRTEPLPGVGRSDEVQEAAFSLSVGGVSAPVKTLSGPVILKVVEHLPAAVPPLSQIRDKVGDAVKRSKADAEAAGAAKKLVEEARSSGDLIGSARKLGFATGEAGPFSRAQPAPDRLPGEAMMAALQTPTGKISDPVKAHQGYYVVKTLDRTMPEAAELEKEREQTTRELLETKRGQTWESWLSAVRAKAKVEVHGRPAAPRG